MKFVTAISEDVCRGIRNVKSLIKVFYRMRCFVMFVTAVCKLLLLQQQQQQSLFSCPKNIIKISYLAVLLFWCKVNALFINSVIYWHRITEMIGESPSLTPDASELRSTVN